jgi:DNA invertase Pin-like site-specific DNA recombinase
LVVWKLDRLGRSLSDLIKIVKALEISRIGFKSLQEGFFDTSSSWGNLIFQLFAAFAEFELNTIRERTHAGLKAARARGRVGGRRKKITEADLLMLKTLSQNQALSVVEICEHMRISRATYYRYLSPSAQAKNENIT